MNSRIQCDIVIPVVDQMLLTKQCVESIFACTDSPYRLILVDNGSADKTRVYLESLKDTSNTVTILKNDYNKGWIKGVNQGIGASLSDYVCVMNNDTIVRTQGWLSKMIALAEAEPTVGLINPRFDLKDEGSSLGEPFMEVDFCRGYCILIKRDVIKKIGLFDEAYGVGYYDDDDYSVRAIQAGFRCVQVREVFVEHLKDTTFSSLFGKRWMRNLHEKNKLLFYSKWGRRLRLLFIVNGTKQREKNLSDILFSLARRQHILYIWNLGERLRINHSNVREKIYRFDLPPIYFIAKIISNRMRKREKRFDAVFVEEGAPLEIPGIVGNAYRFTLKNDEGGIMKIVETMTAGTKKESREALELF